jgi:hypothetical protein
MGCQQVSGLGLWEEKDGGGKGASLRFDDKQGPDIRSLVRMAQARISPGKTSTFDGAFAN